MATKRTESSILPWLQRFRTIRPAKFQQRLWNDAESLEGHLREVSHCFHLLNFKVTQTTKRHYAGHRFQSLRICNNTNIINVTCYFTMTSYKGHGVSNHLQLDCRFDGFFRLKTTEAPKLSIADPFVIWFTVVGLFLRKISTKWVIEGYCNVELP